VLPVQTASCQSLGSPIVSSCSSSCFALALLFRGGCSPLLGCSQAVQLGVGIDDVAGGVAPPHGASLRSASRAGTRPGRAGASPGAQHRRPRRRCRAGLSRFSRVSLSAPASVLKMSGIREQIGQFWYAPVSAWIWAFEPLTLVCEELFDVVDGGLFSGLDLGRRLFCSLDRDGLCDLLVFRRHLVGDCFLFLHVTLPFLAIVRCRFLSCLRLCGASPRRAVRSDWNGGCRPLGQARVRRRCSLK